MRSCKFFFKLIKGCVSNFITEKQQQRQNAYAARNAQAEKEKLSQIICNQFVAQSAYQSADTVMWYVHCRSEVRTLKALTSELTSNRRIVIPYCIKDLKGRNKLGLWLLNDMSELTPGTWGILEPPKSRWEEKGKKVIPRDLDVVMVPGVAFDRKGGRLGNGAGYYDRLLNELSPDALIIAVCYESQICDKVIMEEHDVFMDRVITEKNCYRIKR